MTDLSTAATAAMQGPSNAALNAVPQYRTSTPVRRDLSCPAKSLHWRNRSVSVELFRNGCIQPLQVPTVFLLEQVSQGTDLSTLMDPRNPNSLMAEYLDAQGYQFPWGCIVENAAAEGSTVFASAHINWRFVPVQCWRAHLGVQNGPTIADRLSEFAEAVNVSIVRCLPDYMLPAQRRRHDLFSLTCRAEDHDRARRWMSDKLLPKILPRLIAVVDNKTCLPGLWVMPATRAQSH